jgi:predicted PurR-regulated permease PerM
MRRAPPASEAASAAEATSPAEHALAGHPGEPKTVARKPAVEEPPRIEPASAGEERSVQPPRAVIPRWVQLVLLPFALVVIWAIAKAAGTVLLIFIVAGLIALILNPAVAFLHRPRLPRGVAVLAVYLAFFLTVGGIGFLLANPISNQARAFTHNLPHIVNQANSTIASLQTELDKRGIHLHLVKQGKTALQSVEAKVAKSATKLASFGGSLLTEVASAIFDIVLIFVLSVYMLVYGQQIGRLVRRVMPDGDGTRADDYPLLVQRAVSRYVGGQLLFSLIMGLSTGIALWVFGVTGIFPDGQKYAVAFAMFYGVMELVPYIGPFLGALPPVLLALVTEPVVALWVALLFVGLQQLEGHVVAPQVFGHTLRINPLLVIFALLLGLHVDGVAGALVALPLLSVLRETVVYLSRHVTFEPWDHSKEGLL